MSKPTLPDEFYEYLLETEASGFNEDCDCISCQMVRDGFKRWEKTHKFLEWEKTKKENTNSQ